ncbi:hypothetical protein [Micromonospora avicenniae]|uniref:hypothetical protein n=1 Tax=Micromonospora avicenniae TaxID=1198245 RepID=UPI003331C904
MPKHVLVRFAVLGSAVVAVVMLCGLAWQELGKAYELTAGVKCTDADQRLADQLAQDPVLTSSPPGTTIARSHHHAPCEGDSSQWGLATAIVDLPPDISMESVIDHYRSLLTAGHWRIAAERAPADRLCADRAMNGQQVRLLLLYGNFLPPPHTTRKVTIQVSFLPKGEDLFCSG